MNVEALIYCNSFLQYYYISEKLHILTKNYLTINFMVAISY